MQMIEFNGWKRCIRLANRDIELVITRDVGPRILRAGFNGKPNLFAEIAGQQGEQNEPEWQIRGGHRFWVAPEAKPWSYELDNQPYAEAEPIENGVRTVQDPGPLTGLAKIMEIRLLPDCNRIVIDHTLENRTQSPVMCAPWALSVMGLQGQAIIPLPAKIPHTERLTHNQQWSLWGYTDLSDPRWTLGRRYLLFRQDPARGPNKIGIAHEAGWVAYQREGFLFVKHFAYDPLAAYPDGGCNFETFSNEDFLEIESLGALTTLEPGDRATHREQWELFADVPLCRNDADVDREVLPRVSDSDR